MHSDSLNNNQPAGSPREPAPQRLNRRQELVDEYGDDQFLFLSEPEYDEAILGVCHRFGQEAVIAYDYNKVCDIASTLINDDDPTNVVEYVEFNIIGAYVGERTPIFVDIV
jgi:hypothetical protein